MCKPLGSCLSSPHPNPSATPGRHTHAKTADSLRRLQDLQTPRIKLKASFLLSLFAEPVAPPTCKFRLGRVTQAALQQPSGTRRQSQVIIIQLVVTNEQTINWALCDLCAFVLEVESPCPFQHQEACTTLAIGVECSAEPPVATNMTMPTTLAEISPDTCPWW